MNVIVIGLGSMGKRRIRLMKAMKLPVDIVGIDSKPDRRNDAKSQFGIECFTSLEEAEKLAAIDCAFICTSPLSHANLIQSCLAHGYHVFTEINLISDMYDENIALAQEKGLTLFLSSTTLYKSEMQFIEKRLKQNAKKCAYSYHVGQYLPDWHPWDNLKDFFVGNKKTNGCREILAIELPWIQNTFGKIEKVNDIKRNLTDLNLGFPDTYLIQLEHENGNVGSLIVDVVSRQAVRRLEIFNEDIYIKWNGTPDSLYEKDIASGELKQVQAGEYTHEKGYGDFINEYAYMKEIEEFFDVIKGKEPLYSFEKDKEILGIINEIEK